MFYAKRTTTVNTYRNTRIRVSHYDIIIANVEQNKYLELIRHKDVIVCIFAYFGTNWDYKGIYENSR